MFYLGIVRFTPDWSLPLHPAAMAPDDVPPAWSDLLARILREMCHDLNGRASAVRGLAELSAVLAPGARPHWDESELLMEEAERLDELALNLGSLVADAGHGAQLLDLQPLIDRSRSIISLLDCFRDARLLVLPPEGSPPGVRCVPARAIRVLLLAMESVLTVHQASGVAGPALVQLVNQDGRAEIRLRPGGAPDTAAPPPDARGATNGTEVEWDWMTEGDAPELRLRFPPARGVDTP